MKKQGTVVRWNEAKGFGFIHGPQSNAQLFFHIRDWRGNATPAVNQRVSFEEIHVGSKGPRAMDVRPESDRAAPPARPRQAVARPPAQNPHRQPRIAPSRRVAPSRQASPAWPALLLMLIWAGLLIGGIVLDRLSWLFLPAAFILNLGTFYAYWKDKYAAAKGQWRTAEDMLHGLGLLGGWPGAWFAHQILRHKSVKQAFRSVYWGTASIHVIALALWVFLPWLPIPALNP
jgi:uncharacterized membrane protein YsdA (DUF1294 family)/cold shock CspA family protein